MWVTSGHVTDVTSGYVTDVTSGYVTDVTSGYLTDVTSGYDITSGSTEQQFTLCPTVRRNNSVSEGVTL